MKKIIFAGMACLFLMGCTLPQKEVAHNYDDLYTAYVQAELTEMYSNFEPFSFLGDFESQAKIAASLEVPGLITFSGATDMSILNNSILSQSIQFFKPHFSLKGILGEVKGAADEIDIINTNGKFFFFYDTITQNNLIPPGFVDFIQKYNAQWIQGEESPSGSYDRTVFQILSLLSSRNEMEKYLTTYKLFSPTGDPTENEGKLLFPIKLHKENLVDMLAALAQNIQSNEFSDQEKKQLLQLLEKTDIGGTVTFNPKDSLFIDLNVTIATKESQQPIATLHFSHEKNEHDFSLTNEANTGLKKGNLHSSKDGPKQNITLTIEGESPTIEEGASTFSEGQKTPQSTGIAQGIVFQVQATLDARGHMLTDLNVSLKSPHNDDNQAFSGSFTRNKEAFYGSLEAESLQGAFKGTIKNKQLTSFQIVKGTLGEYELHMDLQKDTDTKDGYIQGNMILKENGTEIGSAEVGIKIQGSEVFGIRIKNIKGNIFGPAQGSSATFFVEGTKKPTNKKVEEPKLFVEVEKVVKDFEKAFQQGIGGPQQDTLNDFLIDSEDDRVGGTTADDAS